MTSFNLFLARKLQSFHQIPALRVLKYETGTRHSYLLGREAIILAGLSTTPSSKGMEDVRLYTIAENPPPEPPFET